MTQLSARTERRIDSALFSRGQNFNGIPILSLKSSIDCVQFWTEFVLGTDLIVVMTEEDLDIGGVSDGFDHRVVPAGVDDPHVFSLKDEWQGPKEIDDGFLNGGVGQDSRCWRI
jgi:hypothetical protein